MKRNKKLGRGGFSLLELLIAVLALGIIVSPLLRSFLIGAQIARKSADLGTATLLAQNTAEAIEAADVNALLELSVPGMEPPHLAGGARPYDDSYTLTLAGTDGTALADYSVVATLTAYSQTPGAYALPDDLSAAPAEDAEKAEAYQRYHKVNDVEITQYTPMDAVFNQSDDGSLDPDARARETLRYRAEVTAAAAAAAAGGENAALLTDIREMQRTILVRIHENSADSYDYACEYSYVFNYAYQYETTGDTPTTVTATDRETFSIPYVVPHGEGAGDGRLCGLYVFFSANAAVCQDGEYTVEILHDGVNKSELTPVDVFLIPQREPGALTPLPKVKVAVKDTELNSTTVHIDVDSYQFDRFTYTERLDSFIWATHTQPSDTLVSRDQKNRIYAVNVRVVYNGSDVYTLASSKLC